MRVPTDGTVEIYSKTGESVLIDTDKTMFANDGLKAELFTLGNHPLARMSSEGKWVVASNGMWGWCLRNQERGMNDND